MNQPQWVLNEVVLAIHKQQLAEHGGPSGVRDEGLLASALARPKNLFDYEPDDASIQRLAACYAFGLARNHPFLDGNKRVALVVSLLFLKLNGMDLSAPMEERYQVFMALADGGMGEDELSAWFERYCNKLKT
ncbi:MAG: type II toxin-antitoxin system death-on-curing family toxin [Thermodesulfobacteriota bacterium]|nr:type II toxin-antitoxin system death-on-curing family toxin [Thermodesulfobacteriota bacterium]